MTMTRSLVGGIALHAAFLLQAGPAAAHAPSGAIFTTLSDGTEVNLNQFPSKPAVYLDGGPGPGAPATAAGLDDGTYVFMVTDPSGKVLLSTDPAQCRRFTVSGGVISGVVPTSGCEHATGLDVDHGAVTVQLIPFNDTPNPGGVYKVWVTRVEDFPAACLSTVDCTAPGTKHGFGPSHSKTDNFKVSGDNVRQIDTRFFRDRNGNGRRDRNEEVLKNLSVVWTDTNGVSNIRYADPNFAWGTLAHVEVPEDNLGNHYITIVDQPGCIVTGVELNGVAAPRDAQGRLSVDVSHNKDHIIEVGCRRK
jgi:hypothetical protein